MHVYGCEFFHMDGIDSEHGHLPLDSRLRIASAIGAACGLVLIASPAWGHGFVGQRFFPATLAVDDPFVADELSLPTFA